MYESELKEARDLYNESEKEKARVELKIQNLEDQLAEYKRKLVDLVTTVLAAAAATAAAIIEVVAESNSSNNRSSRRAAVEVAAVEVVVVAAVNIEVAEGK